MALNPKLYYYSGGWQDITQYIVEPGISEILYRIDNKVQGEAMFLDLVLSIECPYYGSNKYKLELGGSDYWLLGAPGDGIKTDYINRQIHLVLVDYFFYVLTGKIPLTITGWGDAASIAGESIIAAAINYNLVNYNTNQASIDLEGFSSTDGINFYDGLGNTINIIQSNIRYRTKGMIQGITQTTNMGQVYVNIRKILNDIITAEGLTLDVDFGYEQASDYGTIALDSDFPYIQKVWDSKIINGHIIVLFSESESASNGYAYLASYDTDNNLVDYLSWETRDWAEGNSGEDWIIYQIFPDYRNNKAYLVGLYCASYNPGAGTNNYYVRIVKVSVASNGNLTQDYSAIDSSGTDFGVFVGNTAQRTNMRYRNWRFDSNTCAFGGLTFDRITWYSDAALAGAGKFRIIIRPSGSSYDLYVIDPDLWNAGSANDYYTYTLPAYGGYIIPDWMNGSVVFIYLSGGNWYKKFYRVNQATLTVGYSVAGDGGRIHADDDPGGHTGPPIAIWRESFYYTDTIPTSIGEFYYHLPQIANGVLVRQGIYNQYTEEKDDYFGLYYTHDEDFAGSAWDDSIDRALVWSTDLDAIPNDLYWDIKDHYTYKRMYLYQPYIYIDRKQQFIDAFASAGFFYEQKNGNVRLFRIKGSGSNIGTITDADLLNLREINEFSRFADEYSIRVLTTRITKESGTVEQAIKTLINDYGFFSKLNAQFYSDWTAYLKLGQAGLEFLLDAEQFYSITSTYLPNLGDLVTYDSANYMIIQAALDLVGKRIAIQCIAV